MVTLPLLVLETFESIVETALELNDNLAVQLTVLVVFEVSLVLVCGIGIFIFIGPVVAILPSHYKLGYLL